MSNVDDVEDGVINAIRNWSSNGKGLDGGENAQVGQPHFFLCIVEEMGRWKRPT